MKSDAPSERQTSATDLVGELLAGLSRLVSGEVALARAEAKESLKEMAGALIMAVLAAILCITALNVLAGAAVAGLVAAGLAPGWAGAVVGVAIFVLALVLLQMARKRLAPSNLVPSRSVANLRRDAETFKTMVTPGATADLHS